MITRRAFLKFGSAAAAIAGALGFYAVGAAPFAVQTTRYHLKPEAWKGGPPLRIAVLTDFHAGYPWMTPERIARIVARTNAYEPDVTVLLGDYLAGHPFVLRDMAMADWATPLGKLEASLGVYSILGNHDWWGDRAARERRAGPTAAGLALEAAGVPVLENDAFRLEKGGKPFWLLGLGDQLAFGRSIGGVDDLPGTLTQVTDDAPAILLAHEPDIFPNVPARVALTLSGHTHAGQVQLFGWAPISASRYGQRFLYGRIHERDADGLSRDLIVSAGLGASVLPVRFGTQPEIVLVELS